MLPRTLVLAQRSTEAHQAASTLALSAEETCRISGVMKPTMAKETQETFTKYERAQMIGARALQISMGAPFKVKLTEAELTAVKYNPIEIAKIEFERGAIPLRVVRPKHTSEEPAAE